MSEYVERIDAGQLLKAVKTPEGYLLAEGYAGRAGVLAYTLADGSIRRELIPPEELFRPDSLGTLGRKPVTLDHPRDEQGNAVVVDASNVATYGVGDVDSEIVEESQGGFVRVRVAIRRADAVDAVQSGRMRGLSQGYKCQIDNTPGIWNGQPYDVVQRRRVYNHLAICQLGRAGYDVRLRVDGADFSVAAIDGPAWPTQQEGLMGSNASIEIGGVRFDSLDPALATGIAGIQAEAEAARADAATNKAKFDAVCKQMDEAKAMHDASMAELEAQKNALAAALAQSEAAKKAMEEAKNAENMEEDKGDSAAFLAKFAARQKLLALATRLKVDGAETKGAADLHRAIVQIHNPEIKVDSETPVYLAAYCDGLSAQMLKADAGQTNAAGAAAGGTQGVAPKKAEQIRADAMAEYKRNTFGA